MALTEEMTILLKFKDQASKGLGAATKGVEKYKTQIRLAGAAVAGAGVAIEGLARKVAPLNEAVAKLAIQTGLTDKEIRGMATSLSNATFPLDEVIGLMGLAAKQGLEGKDSIAEYARFWDMVGDATGLSSQQLAKSGAALKAVGIEVGKENKLLKAFGLITTQTTGNVGDFLKFVERLAPDLTEAGISVDETAALITALERELGLTARTARTEFREAVEQAGSASKEVQDRIDNLESALSNVNEGFAEGKISAKSYAEQTDVLSESIGREQVRLKNLTEGGLPALLEQLGLTQEQMDKYTQLLDENGDVISEMADAHADAKTRMQELQSSMSDALFTMGPFIQSAASIAPILLIIGPAMGLVTVAQSAWTIATKAGVVALKAMRIATSLALGPFGLILLAITGLIAIGILLWKNWDEVSAKAKEIWTAIARFFTDIWDRIVGIFRENWRLILGILFPAFGISMLIHQHWGAIVGVVIGIWERVKDVFKAGINFVIGLINSFIDRINSIKISIPGVSIPGLPDIPGFSIGVPQIPRIPRLAAGAIIDKPTLALVGEKGPEAVIPLNRLGAIGGGASIVIQGPLLVVEGSILGIDVDDLVDSAIGEIERRTGISIRG